MKNKKAFSLIEVMMVVVIIGILSAMAIPSFNKSMNESREKKARVTLELIYNAERVYRLDKRIYIAATTDTGTAWAGLSEYINNPNSAAEPYIYVVNSANTTVFSAKATQKNTTTHYITVNQDNTWAEFGGS